MTYATEAGLVIGQQYKIKDSNQKYSHAYGLVFTFSGDDRTDCVKFSCPLSYDSDGWCYFDVAAMEPVDVVVALVAPAFSIDVNNGTTTFFVAKELTAAQIAAVFAAAGLV